MENPPTCICKEELVFLIIYVASVDDNCGLFVKRRLWSLRTKHRFVLPLYAQFIAGKAYATITVPHLHKRISLQG